MELPDPPEHILQFFEYAHLPASLQMVSLPFCDLAKRIVGNGADTPPAGAFIQLPRNPERTVALRKLLEAKDAAVRAYLAKEPLVDHSPPPVPEPGDRGGHGLPGTPPAPPSPTSGGE